MTDPELAQKIAGTLLGAGSLGSLAILIEEIEDEVRPELIESSRYSMEPDTDGWRLYLQFEAELKQKLADAVAEVLAATPSFDDWAAQQTSSSTAT